MSILSRKAFLRHGALAAVAGIVAMRVGPLAAESQSSDSASGCSNGRCERIDRLTVEGRDGRRTTTRTERWSEGDGRRRGDLRDDDRRRRDRGGRRRDDDDD